MKKKQRKAFKGFFIGRRSRWNCKGYGPKARANRAILQGIVERDFQRSLEKWGF